MKIEEYIIIDDEGKPILDQDGNPKIGWMIGGKEPRKFP